MRAKQTKPTPTPRPTGAVRADELIPLAVLRDRLGLGNKGIRTLREAGLPVRRLGRQGFVLGRDVLDFFGGLPADGKVEQ